MQSRSGKHQDLHCKFCSTLGFGPSGARLTVSVLQDSCILSHGAIASLALYSGDLLKPFFIPSSPWIHKGFPSKGSQNIQELGTLGLKVCPDTGCPLGHTCCMLAQPAQVCHLVPFHLLLSCCCFLLIQKDRSGESWNRWALPFILIYSRPLGYRKKDETNWQWQSNT